MTDDPLALIAFISIAVLVVVLFLQNGARTVITATSLPDHDLSENKVTSTSTQWRHSYSCPHCHEQIGHQEFMTKICLSCGCAMGSSLDIPSSAWRRVVHQGRWTDHARIYRQDFIRIDGVMTPVRGRSSDGRTT